MPTDEDVYQRIQQRAYELSQRHAPADGDAVSDWLQAEVEVLEQCRAVPQADEGSETAAPNRRAKTRSRAKEER